MRNVVTWILIPKVGWRLKQFSSVRNYCGPQLGLILKEGMTLASSGLLIGFLGSFAIGRLMRGMWYGIGSLDPLAFSAVAAALIVSAVFACYVPARHAMRVDPVTALRQD